MKGFGSEQHAQTIIFINCSMILQVFEHVKKSMQKEISKVMFLDQFPCHRRHGFDCVGVRRRFKRDRKNDGLWVGKKIVQILIKSTLGAVYMDEGRDPREGEGEGEGHPLPRVGGDGLKSDKTPKPPQPRGLVGLFLQSFLSHFITGLYTALLFLRRHT